MKNRKTNSTAGNEPKQESFGLIAWLEQTRVVLPLKGVDCKFNICGGIGDVHIDQVFIQENTQPLNCLYTFPLPSGAAVYKCEMHVNGRMIRAKVEERDKARKLAENKKAEGHRTALIEMDRDNIFSLSLGNLQPDDVIVIRLSYFQTVERLGKQQSLRVPFSPGVRYIPGRSLLRDNKGQGTVDDTGQVPDASRITPPRIDRFHSDAAQLGLQGRIQPLPGTDLEIQSPSHTLSVFLPDKKEDAYRVGLAEKGTVPDRDLVIRWTEQMESSSLQPGAWIDNGEKDAHAIVELHAPAHTEGAGDFEQDVYFLIDRSGSMHGAKWTKAIEAFRGFLNNLGEKDRAFATFFETDHHDLVEEPYAPVDLLSLETVKSGLEQDGTGGGTNMLPALDHVLGIIGKESPDRHRSLIVITDGQMGNEREILNSLQGHPELRVHTFGIDTNVNDHFLKEMAEQQRGTCCLQTPADDITGTVSRLGTRITSPAVTSLEIEGPWEQPAGRISDLFAGETLAIILRGTENYKSTKPAEFRITGTLPDGSPWSRSVQARTVTSPAISLLWSQRHIRHLINSGREEKAIEIAKAKNIICSGTSFVAWDEAEKIATPGPLEDIYQPSMVIEERLACLAPLRHLQENPCDSRRMFSPPRLSPLLDAFDDWAPPSGAAYHWAEVKDIIELLKDLHKIKCECRDLHARTRELLDPILSQDHRSLLDGRNLDKLTAGREGLADLVSALEKLQRCRKKIRNAMQSFSPGCRESVKNLLHGNLPAAEVRKLVKVAGLDQRTMDWLIKHREESEDALSLSEA
jgi:Ca-activated chloride channel family protein